MIAGIDVFCGIGGLTHGLVLGGVNVVAGIDIDPNCQYAYEANNSAKFIKKDVQFLEGKEIRDLWPKNSTTLLAGCAPCQPFSTYSRKYRKAGADEKWSLVAHFGRIINESRPDFVTMENVPQLLDHPVFNEFIESIGEYQVWSGIVDCSLYGVPQTRKRLVLLASRHGPISLVSPDSSQQPATVKDAISHLKKLKAGESDERDRMHSACRLSKLNLRRIKASKPGGTWRDWNSDLIAGCHRRKTGATYPSVYGRMEWDAPAPTITTQCFGFGNGRFGHPDQNRAITLREAAILQSFPKSYKFLPPGKRPTFSVLGRLIGNAVPVKLGEIIAASVVAANS
jgi:DNA (cytosine-5)-methyltransferase 1